jgi:hypothetical protein
MDLEKIISELLEKRWDEAIMKAIDGKLSPHYNCDRDLNHLLQEKVTQIMREEIDKRTEEIRARFVSAYAENWDKTALEIRVNVVRTNNF